MSFGALTELIGEFFCEKVTFSEDCLWGYPLDSLYLSRIKFKYLFNGQFIKYDFATQKNIVGGGIQGEGVFAINNDLGCLDGFWIDSSNPKMQFDQGNFSVSEQNQPVLSMLPADKHKETQFLIVSREAFHLTFFLLQGSSKKVDVDLAFQRVK